MEAPIESAPRDVLRAMGGYWFMSSPYTNQPDREEAFKAVCRAAGALMADGVVVYSPIAHGHTIEREGGVELSHGEWMTQCRPFLRSAHGLIVLRLPGWQVSPGVTLERRTAQQRNMMIYTMEPI